ncbi:aspartate/glutamate racemase family protein [Lentibacillus sp. CBA3610]|uniref:aspartate/glutamate racemase family protein n=1 Tax=Lentibacillus sp. CBA3610 TaxID=2518176 RepID=UPI0015959E6A|nr:aspartate/glutamate racemase family protein [Lentibacillus sp. CBA3610]QKY70133.1 aspartate/glutamate racemase family protein [Lentibacillus sp. CBA3610]
MIYQANPGQVFYGHTIGILMLDTFVPMIPGDMGNATSYSYPVLYHTLNNITANKAATGDRAVLPELITGGNELVQNGAKAITADCGFLVYYQKELRDALNVPVFLSSLLQLPFMLLMLSSNEKVGIITADSRQIDAGMLQAMGHVDTERVIIRGLENTQYFYDACTAESGTLDKDKIEEEVVAAALNMVQQDPNIKAILLECSFLPPYAAAIQDVVELPVFDYKTMIDYVHSTFRKPVYNGYL